MSKLGALLCSGGLFALRRLASFHCAPQLYFWLPDLQKINKSNCGSWWASPGLVGLSLGVQGETGTGTQLCFSPAQAGGSIGNPQTENQPNVEALRWVGFHFQCFFLPPGDLAD